MPVAVRTKKFVLKPANPQADPRFQAVKQKVGQKATQLKKHPPAKQKASEAAKAAKGPPNEKAAGAKGKQVDELKDAKAETPPADSFLATLRAEIEKVMPATTEAAADFMEGGAESQMKGAVGGNVKDQKEAASGDLKKTSDKPPNEGGVPTKEVAAIPPDPNVPVTPVNGAAGMPQPKPESEITEKQTKADAQTAMKENRLEGKRLQNKHPSFEKLKSEKGNVDRTAEASPGKYRAGEKQTLGKAASQANVTARTGVTALTTVKNKSKSAVQARQEAQKQKDEQRRKAVTDKIEAMYTETKIKVDQNLNSLERDVMAIFDPGCASAIASFKANTNREIDKFYDKRYEGVSGKAQWVIDKFKDTPPEVKQIIQNNLKSFTASMDALAVRVAKFVDMRLNKAKADISAGQAKIKAFVASLPKDLKSVGQEAEKAMESRFNEMRDGVESKKNDLAQKLAEKYKAAHDQANELAKKIEEENAGAFKKFADALGEIVKMMMEFKAKLQALLRKAADTIDLILDDPVGFLGNLIGAIKAGVNQFVGNIWTHLKAGFMKWLFGSLAEAGVEIPSDLSLVSIFKMVMGVLGITYPRMRAKAVKLLGPTAVAVVEQLIKYIQVLIEGGPAKLWEQVKSDIGDLKAMVIDAIQSWVVTTIIKQATIKLLSFFNPAGALIQAIMAIYNTVMFIIESASQIMAFVEAVINSVSSIAQGAIGAAANWIEQALARMIPLVIGFLARLIGLGGISKKVKEFITKVQTKVDQAIDKAIAKVVATVKKLFGKLGGGRDDSKKQKDLQTALSSAQAAVNRFAGKKVGILVLRPLLAGIKLRYRLASLEAVKKGNRWAVKGSINPTGEVVTDAQVETKDGGDVQQKAAEMLRPRLNQDMDEAQVDAVMAQVLGELRPQGLSSLKYNFILETGELEFVAAASPPKALFKYIFDRVKRRPYAQLAVTIRSKSRDLRQGLRDTARPFPATITYPSQMSRKKKAPIITDPVGISSTAFVSGQGAAGSFVITSPKRGDVIQMVAWNTNTRSHRDATGSHAERQFVEWFDRQKEDWRLSVDRVVLQINISPCSDCTGLLCAWVARNPHIKAKLSWGRKYPGTTAGDIAQLKSCFK